MKFVSYTDWEQLPAGADQLFSLAEQDSLFFSRRWFENLTANALDEDQHILLACVLEEDRVLAILPLRTHGSGNWHSLHSYYSSLFSLLITRDRRDKIIDCLADGLDRLDFRSLRLEPCAEDDASLDKLQQAMLARGFESHRFFRFINWFHRFRGQSYDRYMDDRPSRLRNTIARKSRKLRREQGYKICLYTDNNLQQALADYDTIYRASWKGGERFTGFIPALLRTMAQAGWLRFAILYINKQPAAAQIWFVVHGKASIFRLAYDEKWKHYSPGSILTAYLMELVIDTDKAESIDFLHGNEGYKKDWMAEHRDRWGLVFLRPEKQDSKTNPLARLLGWLRW